MRLRQHPGSAPSLLTGRGSMREGDQDLPSQDTPTPTFGRELRCLRAEVPEAHGGVSGAARQVPGRGGITQLSAMPQRLPPHPEPPTRSRTLVLSRGAEGHRDDGLGVSLQGAGAAGHGPHPEHRLRLVDDVQDLLRLHALPRQGLLQRHHDLGIVDEEGERHRFILRERGWAP